MELTYLLINIFSIAIPLIASFDKRLKFYQQWKYFLPGMIFALIFFIAWDIWFTHIGVWGFNQKYLTGLNIVNLPLEEWLFFISIPYACVFTYDALTYLIKKDYFEKYVKVISWVLIIILITTALFNLDKKYTSLTFILTSLFVLLHLYLFKSKFLGRFYFTYMIILIPFFIVNGILTGSLIEGEVVWYNNEEILGIRIFTIPIEDSVYGLLLILMNISFLEWFRKKKPFNLS